MEFESGDAGQRRECPHCRRETVVYIPLAPLPPTEAQALKKQIPVLGILSLILPCAGIAVCFLVAGSGWSARYMGFALFALLTLNLSMLAGPMLAGISLRRREKPAVWAWLGILLFGVPALVVIGFYLCQLLGLLFHLFIKGSPIMLRC